MHTTDFVTFPGLGKFGRLGNAMFQISATYAHALRLGTEPRFPPWPYAAELGLPARWFTAEQADTIYDAGADGGGMVNCDTYAAPWNYQPIPREARVLHGYFQCPRFWEDYYDEICLLWASLRRGPLAKGSHSAIHVRRGDYLLLKHFHPGPRAEYYYDAADKLPCSAAYPRYIVSDDIEWCFNTFEQVFLSALDPVSDLSILATSTAIVMSNSSFSWWGAYLSNARTVIYPKPWFGPALADLKVEQLLLPHWEGIEA